MRHTMGTITTQAEKPTCLKVFDMETTFVLSVGFGVSTEAMHWEGTPPSPALPVEDIAPPPEETAHEPPPQTPPEAPEEAPVYAADPRLDRPRRVAEADINPYPQWPQVVERIQACDPMLYGYLKKSRAYFDGVRVLIDGGKTFRDFIRANKGSQRLIKKLIAEVSGIPVPIGPYEPAKAAAPKATAEQSLHKLEALGLEVTITDSARRREE